LLEAATCRCVPARLEFTVSDFVVWQSQWNTEIPAIDEHHIGMVRHLNRLARAIAQPATVAGRPQVIEDSLKQYLQITREHFEWEEQHMRALDFPDYAGHKREHTMLLAELNQLLSDIRERRFSVDDATLQSLKHWLLAHITLADKDYARYCSSRGQTTQG
jgi:hemerythrin